MFTISRTILTLLAVMALAAAQFAGLHRGWVCACSGDAVVVAEQWCTGAESQHGHPDGDHDHDPLEHKELRESLNTVAAIPLQFVSPPLLECLMDLPAERGVQLAGEQVEKQYALSEWLEDPGGGAPCRYARRTVVMLI